MKKLLPWILGAVAVWAVWPKAENPPAAPPSSDTGDTGAINYGGQGIQITSALYGAPGAGWVEVKDAAAAQYQSTGVVTVENELLGGDPFFGKEKRLRIYYLEDGAPKNKTLLEHETFDFDLTPA